MAFSGYLGCCCWIEIINYFYECKFDDLAKDDGAVSMADYEV